jgi:tetrahydromethanopterin S-methyltransferase subunit G
MNIILMTILLTITGVCLVAFLTWLGISSYKFMKFRKKADGAFKHLERWIDDNNNDVHKKMDDIFEELNKTISEYNIVIHKRFDDDMYIINKDINDLNSKIDSRCDKLQDKIDNQKLIKS